MIATITSIYLHRHYDKYVNVVEIINAVSMDQLHGTYVDDEFAENHCYDDNTDDDRDNSNHRNGHHNTDSPYKCLVYF